MDSLTHLIAGALTPLAFRGTPKRAALVGFGIAAGELPDVDIFFGAGAEALLTLHRGITHSLFWQPVMVLFVVIPFYLWLQCRGPALLPPHSPSPPQGRRKRRNAQRGLEAFGFGRMWLIALAAVLLHIYLDCMTTFGTQILLPFSDVRVGLPALFIVDPLLTLPALAFLLYALRLKPEAPPARYSPRSRTAARIALAWLLLYPLACLGVNAAATAGLAPVLAGTLPGAGAQTAPPACGSLGAPRLRLMPEPFSPFIWKAVIEEGDKRHMGATALWAADKTALDSYARPDPRLYAALKGQHSLFAAFEAFAPLMVQMERPAPDAAQANGRGAVKEYAFMDLRYVIAPASPVRLAGRSDPNFILEARVDDAKNLLAYRFLHRGNDAANTPWTAPDAPEPDAYEQHRDGQDKPGPFAR